MRATHWLNALAVILMVMSGWQIYDANPFWGFSIPRSIALGGWLGGGIMWHFAAMWLLGASAVLYMIGNILSGRLFCKFFPLSPVAFWRDLIAALRGRLAHDDLAKYNAVQKAAYLFAIADIFVLILSGLVLWKSVQFHHLRDLLGGYEIARRIHFFAMTGMVGFIIVHVVMSLLVPRTIKVMITGRN